MSKFNFNPSRISALSSLLVAIIDPLEVLGGAAFGTLAGWTLPEGQIIGGGSWQVVVIDPNQDLTLMLHSDLAVIPFDQAREETLPVRNTFKSRSF